MPGSQDSPSPTQTLGAGRGGGVMLTHDAAVRTRDAVKFVEDTFLTTPGQKARRQSRASVVPSAWVRTTSAISARSGANCTSGTAVFLNVSAAGVFSDSSVTLTVWNGTDKTVSSGAGRYFLAHWANGKWWLGVPGSCTFLS